MMSSLHSLATPPSETDSVAERSRGSGNVGVSDSAIREEKPRPLRLLLLSSDTGGGHRSAAKALKEQLQLLAKQRNIRLKIEVRRVLEESTWLNRVFASIYNTLLQRRQHWVHYYYSFINWLKPNQSLMVLLPMWHYAKRLFYRDTPTLVVSVHPMTQHFYAFMQQFMTPIQGVPLVTVVTDPFYGFWKGWACPSVEQYIVASDSAKQQLVDYHVEADKIHLLGLPVGKAFVPLPLQERLALRRLRDIPLNKLVVFFNAGFVGGGSIPQLLEQTLEALEMQASVNQHVHLVVLTGKNKALLAQCQRWMKQHPHVSVTLLGSTQHMHEWMQLSDVMVSKTGALTTFEALATGLPLLVDQVHPPMPQEAGTARFVEAIGAGASVQQGAEIVQYLQRFISHPDSLQRWREAALAQRTHESSLRIASLLFDKLLCLAFNR